MQVCPDQDLPFLLSTESRSMTKKKKNKIKESEDKILKENIISTQIKLNHNDNFEPNLIGYKDMIYALANSNSSNFTTNNDVEIFSDSSDFFKSLSFHVKRKRILYGLSC